MYLVLDIFLEYFDKGLYLTLLLIWFRFNVFQNNKSIVLNVSISLLILLNLLLSQQFAFILTFNDINFSSKIISYRLIIINLVGLIIFIQAILLLLDINKILTIRLLQYFLMFISFLGVCIYENPYKTNCFGELLNPLIINSILSLLIVLISYLLFTINTSNPFFRKILNYFLIVTSIQLMSYTFQVFEYDNFIKLFMIGLIGLEMIVNSINKNKISS